MKKQKKKKIILISVFAIVVVTTIVLVVVLTNNKNHVDPKPGPNPTTPSSSVIPSTSTSLTPEASSSAISSSSDVSVGYEIELIDRNNLVETLHGTKITYADLPRLSNDGSIFRGWMLEDNLITEDIDIEGNVSLYAAWDTIFSYESFVMEAQSSNLITIINPADYATISLFENINPYVDIYQSVADSVTVAEDKFQIGDGNMIINIDSNTDKVNMVFTTKPNDTNIINLYIDNNVVLNVSKADELTCKINDVDYTPIKSITSQNNEYIFYINIDIEKKMLDVSINNKEFITGYIFESLANVDYLSFGKGEVSNIAIKHTKKLVNYANYYNNLLDEYKDTFDLTLYDNDGEEITTILDNGKASILEQTALEEIVSKYNEVKAAMAAIKTTEEKEFERDYNGAKEAFERVLNSYTYLMLEDMNDPNFDYLSKNAILEAFKDELKDVTDKEELQALKTKYEKDAERYSDTNTILISEYIEYKKTKLYDTYKRNNYKENSQDEYDAIKQELETALTTLTLKTDIDNQFEIADGKFAALKTDKEILDGDKEVAEGELRDYIENDMATAIENLKAQAEAGNQDAKTAYEKLQVLLETCYASLNNSRDKESLEKRLNDIMLEINDYLTYGLGQLNQYKDNKVKMLKAYKDNILSVLSKDTSFDLYTAIENVEIENLDSLGTIDEVKQGYDAAIAKINALAYTDEKTNAIATIIAYSDSKKEDSLYYQYYGSLNVFETRIEDIISRARIEIVKANGATEIAKTIDDYKLIVDDEIAKIRQETEFNITFIIKDAEGNLLQNHEEFKLPTNVIRVLNQTYGAFDYYEEFDKEMGIPTVVISGTKYRCAGAYSKYNSQLDREDYDFNSPITGDQTVIIVWDIIG